LDDENFEDQPPSQFHLRDCIPAVEQLETHEKQLASYMLAPRDGVLSKSKFLPFGTPFVWFVMSTSSSTTEFNESLQRTLSSNRIQPAPNEEMATH